jgi:hypothetical protein
VADASIILGMSLATIYRYMAKGVLRYHKLDGMRLIEAGDLASCKDNRAPPNSGSVERARMRHALRAHPM